MSLTRFIMGQAGATGQALSSTNTGFTGIVNTGGSGVTSDAESNPVGSLAAVMTASSTSGGHYGYKSGLSTNNLGGDVLFKIKTENSGQCPIVWGGTGSQEWQIDYNPTTNKLEFKDDASTTRWTSTPTLAADNATWYWLRWYVVNSATVGQFKVQLSTAADPTTMLETYTSAASFDTGGTAYTDLRIGPKCSTGTQTGVLVMGSWAFDPAATDVPAPYVTAVDYTANPADSAGATDAAAVVQDLVESIADGASVTDTGAPQSIDYGPSTDDPGAATDAAAITADLARTAADTAGGTDLAVASAGVSRTAADPAGLTDSVTALLSWLLTPADPAGGVDQVTLAATVVRGPADPAGGTDALAVVAAVSRSAADSGGGTDLVSASLARSQTSGDAAGGTDQVTFVLTMQRTLMDAAGVADVRTIIIELPVPAGTPAYRIVHTRAFHRTVQGGGSRTVKAMKRRQ